MAERVSSHRFLDSDLRPANRLLASLPPEDFARLQAHLKTIPMKAKQVIHRRNEPMGNVVFPNGGVVSVTTVMNNGAMVEVATIGDEGLVGMNALFGTEMMAGEAMVQVPDTSAEVITVDAFRHEMQRESAFSSAVRRYAQGLLTLMMQSTACMALHPVQERCCRWLLMTHDRGTGGRNSSSVMSSWR